MKKIILTVFAAWAVIGAQAQTLTVKIDGWGNDTIVCMWQAPNVTLKNDTVVAKKGTLTVTNPTQQPARVTLYQPALTLVMERRVVWPPNVNTLTTVVFPDEHEQLRGKLQNSILVLTDAKTEFGQKNMQFTNGTKLKEMLVIGSMGILGDAKSLSQEDLITVITTIIKKTQQDAIKYIHEHPGDEYAAYLLTRLPSEIAKAELPALAPELFEGRLTNFLNDCKQQIDNLP